MALRILAFVLPLGLDTFAIAIALGLRGFRPWRPALLFAIFETVMPVFGIALARVVGPRFETSTAIAGGIILIALGVHVIWEAIHGEEEELEHISFRSWRTSLLAGLSISTDELAIGFPLGASGLPIAAVLIAIMVQTLFVTALGVMLGNRVRSGLARGISRYIEIAAGVIFVLLGLWLIAERSFDGLRR